ncbi:Protein trichome birefringence-like 2 [Striga hermonthica]|uniref:Protein trichome birefringence-like 2 n=1 Tax=Striga hermonthica TaxID=68872 RepID=A0A9N7NMZ2_STRHE|nr:Protein trichome birefringence-like 2 [Striga hermonthica]
MATSFSSTFSVTGLKKLTFSDQFISSARTKIASPFGLGVVFSFIFLTVILFSFSSKGPDFSPLFQGLYSFASQNNNSSSLSSPFGSPQSPVNASLEANAKGSDRIVDSVDENEDLEGAHLGNETEYNKNGSFVVVEDGGKVVKRGEDVSGFRSDVKNESVSGKSEHGREDCVGGVGHGNRSCGAEVAELADTNGDLRSNGTKGFSASSRSFKNCDVFDGRWVRDDTMPYYPPGSCPYIDRDFDCHANGRPDDEYVRWRWQPYDCEIPRFNATDFLERLRGKKLVFVGDSLNRNMWESLVCALRHGVEDKTRVYEISGRHEFKKKGFYAFRFEDYDCSVDFVSSPFLVKESTYSGKNGSFDTLRLDLMDNTTSMYHDADVIIFNTGHWWTHEKTSRGEDYYQEGNYVHPRLKVLEAFKRALATWARWVDKNIDVNKTEVIFRGYSVTHFRGGPWNSGGQCHKETEPIFNETHLVNYPSKMKILEYVLKGMKTPVTYLNISRLTDYRKDGHPSIYRPDYQAAQQEIHAQDCSHWCLPGVPDTWNDLLYVSLLKRGQCSWRN